MTNLEGQTFAGYEIIAKLGQGGMGAVYKARQPVLNRLIALKVMASDLASDRDFVARFKREANAAASLNHENIVQVFSAGESEGSHYIAMEFVEGTTLRHHIESHGRLDPREAIAITILVAQALQHAWNKARLIHRDIKPDNIFLSTGGEVKVGDLGLAKTVGGSTTSLTQTGTAVGSPHYISPEQATGAKEMDFRTDIYSLGGTLYHMLTGQTPYQGDSSMVVMMKHVNDPPPAIFKVWPSCPMPLGLLVGKMLAKNRNSRPASYEELIEQLRGLHDKLKPATVPAAAPISPSDPTQLLTPTPRPAPAPAQPTPRPVVTKTPTVAPKARKSKSVTRNSRLVIGAGALAAVALIAGAVWWFAGSGGGPKVLDLGDGVKMELVAIPPGEFMLGSTKEEQAWAEVNAPKFPVFKNEGDQPRKAAIKRGFWMGRTEVTVAQWKQFVAVTGYRTEAEKQGEAHYAYSRQKKTMEQHLKGASWRDPGFDQQDNHPVCCVSWNDAMAFCEWATERERKAGRLAANQVVRLPTEAEWEYACRAGTQGKFWWGELEEDCENRLNLWGVRDGFEFTSPVDNYDKRGRNKFSLADMLGNVREWCLDDYDATGAHEEPYKSSPARVVRGSSFGNKLAVARCASRDSFLPNSPNCYNGFRVCLGPEVPGSVAVAPAATAEPQAAPPAAASPKFGVLFDGRDTSAWQQRDGGDCQWQVSDGALVAGKGDLDTREKFQDFKLHIEFAVPRDAKQGNSGIYLQGRYEIQILDSFGKPADDGCCGSIFKLKAPTENASKPPDEWQTFDIGFRAAQFNAAGAKTANARVSVTHNGRLIHDYVEIPKSTGKGEPESAAPGPIRLQSYGSPVRFRNIRISPVDTAAAAAPAAAWQDAINLLPLIDPQKDAVGGIWNWQGNNLISDSAKNGRIAIPYQPPQEYDYRLEFHFTEGYTPEGAGQVIQILSKGGRLFSWIMGAKKGEFIAFETIAGANSADPANPTITRRKPALKKKVTYTSIVEVRNDGLKAYLNGELLAQWKTDYSDMSIVPHWKLSDPTLLGVGSWLTGLVIEKLEVREVTGKGTFTRGAPAAQSNTAILQHSNIPAALEAFCNEVAALPAEQQVARVMAKLKELNPGYDGKDEHKVENGAVTELKFSTSAVFDISPVRALTRLKRLNCSMAPQGSMLADLSPLRGLQLSALTIYLAPVKDLSPLQGMPLTDLTCAGSQVSDLGSLAGMPLNCLICYSTKVADLTPLRGMPLTILQIYNTSVEDLSPIQGSALKFLMCEDSVAADPRNQKVLRSIKTLQTINNLPAAEFWRKVEAGEVPKP